MNLGLSSNNGGVGSLLQQIEQSEKQSNAGETEQNDDIFLNFVNSDTRANARFTSSLFVQNEQQMPSFVGGYHNISPNMVP